MGILVGLLLAGVGFLFVVRQKNAAAAAQKPGAMSGKTSMDPNFNFANAALAAGVNKDPGLMKAGNIYSVDPPRGSWTGAAVQCQPGYLYNSKTGCTRMNTAQAAYNAPKPCATGVRDAKGKCPGSSDYIKPPSQSPIQSQAIAKPVTPLVSGRATVSLAPGTVTNLAPTGLGVAISKGLISNQPAVAAPQTKPAVVAPKAAQPPQVSPAAKKNAAQNTANAAKLKSALAAKH